jgi:tetratricopeptide (TPR) repeat protein
MSPKPSKKRSKRTPNGDPTPVPDRLRGRRWILALILIAAAGVYANSVPNEFVWDDDKLIVQDPAIKTTQYFNEIWLKDFFYRHEDDVAYGYYRPVVTLSYMMDYSFWGLAPAGYHVTNILLHVACTLLVALCLLRLGIGDRATLAATALFAIHPIHTENVAWIAGRTDLVAFLFTALSLYLFLRGLSATATSEAGGDGKGASKRAGKKAADRGQRDTAPPLRPATRWLAASLASFALAMLAKEMSLVLLPWLGLIFLLHYRRSWSESIRATLPHAAVAIGYFIWRFGVIHIPGPGDGTEESLFVVLLTAPSLIVRYLGKLLAPLELTGYLQHPYVDGIAEPRVLLPVASLAALTWVAFRLRERFPDLFLMAAMLPVSFLPVLNFKRIAGPLDMGSVMAERFCYFPSFPLVAMLGIGFSLATATARPAWLRRSASAALALLVLVGATATVRRNRDWKDDRTFFEKTLTQTPTAGLLWGNLADVYTEAGDYEAAEEALRRGMEVAPRTDYQIASSLVYWYASQGRAQEAIPLQERIVRKTGRGVAQAKNNLAYLYRVTGRGEEAKKILADLLDEGRDYSDVHVNIAEIYRSQGLPESAIRHYEKAYAESPHDQGIAFALCALYLQTGDAERAETVYREQRRLYPDDPDVLGNMATARFHQRDLEGAIALYRELLDRHPGYVRGRISYAQALFAQGRLELAVAELETAAAQAAGTALEVQARSLLAEARAAIARGAGS